MVTSLAYSNQVPEFLANLGPVKAVGSFVGIFSLLALLKYRNAIKRRYRQVMEESWIFGAGVTMERVVGDDKKEATGVFQNLKLLELDPDFEAQCKREGHQVIGLGDYMAQLKPKGLPKKVKVEDTPKLIQREIEAGMAAALLKVLGPNLGRALLPAVGAGVVQKQAQGLAGNIATKWFLSEEGSISESGDKGGIPVSLMTLLAASDLNAKVNSGKKEPPVKDNSVANLGLSAMDKMKAGEVVKGPTFVTGTKDDFLVPNDFVIEHHFDMAIRGMEEMLSGHDEKGELASTELKMAQDQAVQAEQEHEDAKAYKKTQQEDDHTYDPEDRSLGHPVPVNPRLFPGLHLGWGDALNSHTKREVLKMRLLSILLNKLGSNYDRRAYRDKDLFQVRMKEGGPAMTKPWELVQALQDSGHSIEVVPTSRMTTFGLALCVKEPDQSWSNVPLGVFLETGYEDKNGNMAPAMMPHSGLDLYIKGPLVGKRADGTESELRLQHFVGIEGFCGWHPHSAPEVPFNEAIERGKRLSGDDAVRAAMLAGLYANVLNGLATEMELPFGGYGLTAVCNDSAALIQQCLYGVNTIYPMTSIGKFLSRTLRYAQRFQDKLLEADGSSTELQNEVKELTAIIDAMKKIPSDLNASPSGAQSAATRLLATLQPKMPLRLMKDSKKVMTSILQEEAMEQVEETMLQHAKKEEIRSVEKERKSQLLN